ncbi:trypsin-like peptidase domain-containing protein [Elioraea sp.]|uniref:trypsin-like peptidase domain-containing protein n=1 Tax=Elioraea sp. TaxID=2185103 RepID=UPI003F706EED
MTAARYLKASGLDDRLALDAGGTAAVAQYGRLRELVEARAPAALDLFAEPVLDPKDSATPSRISWYGPASEDPVPLETLRTAQRLLAESELRGRLSALQPLLDDPASAPLVRAALAVPGQGDILWTGTGPVLVNWGIVPASVGDAPEALARHFEATLGRYAPPQANPWRAALAAPAAAVAAVGAAAAGASPGLAAGASPPPLPPPPPPAPPPPGRGAGPGAVGAIAAAVAVVLLLAAVALAAGYYYGWSRLVERMQAGLPPPRDTALDDQLRRAQESVNEGLRRRLAELEGALAGDVCVALGPAPRLDPPSAPGSPGTPQQPALSPAIIPPTAEEQPVRTPAAGPDAPQATNLASLLSDSVVLVIVPTRGPDGREGLSRGSGFAIEGGLVVTNRHVIDNAASEQVVVVNKKLGRVVRASIVAATAREGQDFRPDLAVLRLAEGELPALRLSTAIEPLQPVVAAGFPGVAVDIDDTFRRLMQGDAAATPNPVFTSGTVSGLQEVAGQSLVTHTASITRGNSGGPLADRCGRVVGVNTWGRMERDTLYRIDYAQPVRSLLAFLQQAGVSATADDGACQPAPPPPPTLPAAPPPEAAAPAAPAEAPPAAPAAPARD